MAEFYVAQERAMAPGISGSWPVVIPKPGDPNGRLVKVEGVQDMIDGIHTMINSQPESEVWMAGLKLAIEGYEKAK